jgi:competence protein ComEC
MRAASLTRAVLIPLLLSSCSLVDRSSSGGFRQFLPAEPEEPAGLRLTFFEVGLGDGYLIEFPGGRTLLVDAGIGWRVGRILEYLEARGIERLDGLLLTHPHLDHFGGMARVVESVPVGTFYSNGIRSPLASYGKLEATLDARGVARRVLRRGDRLDELTGAGASLEVLYPDEEAAARGRSSNKNRGTVVLSLTHGSLRFLLTGDAERPEESRLLELEGERLAHQVLKLGHHSGPGSGSERFLEAVGPCLAIAQGTETLNVPLFYPRPNYRIRRVLRRADAVFLTTGRDGAIQLLSDGAELSVRTDRSRRVCCPSVHAMVACPSA